MILNHLSDFSTSGHFFTFTSGHYSFRTGLLPSTLTIQSGLINCERKISIMSISRLIESLMELPCAPLGSKAP